MVMMKNYDESVEINHNPIGLIFLTILAELLVVQDQARLIYYKKSMTRY